MTTVSIVPAGSEEAIAEVRDLFVEYADGLGFDLCFQDFGRELADLPADYVPPDGVLLLAYCDSEVAGCVALRRLDEQTCEMKRMYVRPEHRGQHIGRKLAEAVIAAAHRIGYRHMRLDTLPSMEPAIELYRSLGFRQIEPYRHNPIPGAMFFELDLDREEGERP